MMKMTSRHGILSAILILFVLILQTYQLYIFHFLTDLDRSNNNHSDGAQHQQIRGGTTTRKKSEDNNNNQEQQHFSACLMIMDDNAHLIEWLAYHYVTLPLRRLIIAVDPRSQTSPTQILRRWNGLIQISEWSDEDFMPPALISAHHNPNMSQEETTKLFRQRQEEFYTRCMARLHYESQSWVALIDTDEYILPNTNAHEPYRLFGYTTEEKKNMNDKTVLDLLSDARQQSNSQEDRQHDVPQKFNIAITQKLKETPCLAMTRLTFGVKESTHEEINQGVPYGFDPLKFQTLRWRWHGGRTNKKINKISKSIIDLSRVDPKLFVPTEQVMVHIPIKEYCTPEGTDGNQHLWQLNVQSSLVVHHYAGTWEQWSHRNDSRGKRTLENYQKLMYNKQTDDNIRPWLRKFVAEHGYWQSWDLLKDVGEI